MGNAGIDENLARLFIGLVRGALVQLLPGFIFEQCVVDSQLLQFFADINIKGDCVPSL